MTATMSENKAFIEKVKMEDDKEGEDGRLDSLTER